MSDPFRFRSSHFVTLGHYACLVKGLFALQTETETEMAEHVGHSLLLSYTLLAEPPSLSPAENAGRGRLCQRPPLSLLNMRELILSRGNCFHRRTVNDNKAAVTLELELACL